MFRDKYQLYDDTYRRDVEIFKVLLGIQVLLFKLLLLWSQLILL